MKQSNLFLAVLMVWAWIGSQSANAVHGFPPPSEERAESRKVVPATAVKAILFAQTDDEGIGKGCAANLAAMEMLVRSLPNFKPETDLVVLKGEKATSYQLREAVKTIQIENTETLFVYIAAHGAFDSYKERSWHLFQMPDEQLVRGKLLESLKEKRAQQTVLISDTCNVPLPGKVWFADPDDPRFKRPPAIRPRPVQEPETVFPERRRGESVEEFQARMWEGRFSMEGFTPWNDARYVLPTEDSEKFKKNGYANFQHLLRMHEGVVDISGTSPGEYGWYHPDGGWFTIGFVKALGENLSPAGLLRELFGDRDTSDMEPEPVLWSDFLDRAAVRVCEVFTTRKEIILDQEAPKDEDARKILEKLRSQKLQRLKLFQLKIVY